MKLESELDQIHGSLAGQIKRFNIGLCSIAKLLKGFSRKLIIFTFLKGFAGCCVEDGFDGHCGGSKETIKISCR